VALARLIGSLLFVSGLQEMCLRQAVRAGVLGLVGFILVFFDFLLQGAFSTLQVTALPLHAQAAPVPSHSRPYRRSFPALPANAGEERHQLRWFAYEMTLSILMLIGIVFILFAKVNSGSGMMGGSFRLIHRLRMQNNRMLEINQLHTIRVCLGMRERSPIG
jgi:hypothetical protein